MTTPRGRLPSLSLSRLNAQPWIDQPTVITRHALLQRITRKLKSGRRQIFDYDSEGRCLTDVVALARRLGVLRPGEALAEKDRDPR